MPEPDGWRSRWARIVLAVLAGLATLLACLGWWVHATLLDTDRFTALVEPVVTSSSTIDLVGERVADRVVTGLDVQQRIAAGLAGIDDWVATRGRESGRDETPIADAVPPLAPLAPSLASALQDRVEQATVQRLARPEVADTLVGAVSRSHAVAVAILRQDEAALPDAVDVQGDVVLDLGPLADRAVADLASEAGELLGVDPDEVDEDLDVSALADRLDLDPDRLRPSVVLISSGRLEPWRDGLAMFDRTVALLPLLAAVLAAAAVWVSPRRVTGVVQVSVAIALSVLLTIPAIAVVERVLVADVATPAGRATLVEVVDLATRDLRVMTWILLAASVVSIVVATGAAGRALATVRRQVHVDG